MCHTPFEDKDARMTDESKDHGHELAALRERAKELRCIYSVSAALSRRDEPPQVVFRWVLDAIPPAWQYPGDTTARIEYLGRTHALADFLDTPWRLRSPISVWRTTVGAIEVHYKQEKATAWEGPFLREERELLDNIAHRIGEYLEWKQRELSGERLGAAPEHWRWRQRFAERIASTIDPARFGVQAIYLFGSTEAGDADVGSDIDLIVVGDGDARQRRDLQMWLEGWSQCLAEISFQLYGVPSHGLLDVKYLEPEEANLEISSFSKVGKALQALPVGTSLHSSGSRQ
jgi:Nucleotidyltransferase domain